MEQNRSYFQKRYAALKSERNSWESHWQELFEYFLPRGPRFNVTEVNKGWKRNTKILDNTSTIALRTLASGMMSGITSPARPWFQLRTADPDLNKSQAVKVWLDDTRKRMSEVLLKSNIYTVLPRIYSDMALIGTGCFALLEDKETVIRAYHFPVGSYCLGTDHRNVVNAFYREYQMTVGQMCSDFGTSRVSVGVRNAYEQGNKDTWRTVYHAIEPNAQHNEDALESKFKAYRSVRWETSNEAADSFLSDSGFNEFPIIAPRWDIYGEDIYGSDCPGMMCLPDTKGLQIGQRRKGQVIDKFTDPPMGAPSSLEGKNKSLMAGDITYFDANQGQQGFSPVYEIRNPYLQELGMDLEEQRRRINTAFYRDLFLMIAQSDGTMTATEVNARQEEKLLALSPTYLRLNDELLDPLISRTFWIMRRNGMLLTEPEEMQGVEMTIEYISTMAQSMKMVGITGIERVMTFAGNLAPIFPQVLDKVDPDEALENYADMVGTPPSIIRDKATVDASRAQKAQDAQAQQMMANANAAADTAQKLGNAPVSDENALGQIMARMQGAQGVPQ